MSSKGFPETQRSLAFLRYGKVARVTGVEKVTRTGAEVGLQGPNLTVQALVRFWTSSLRAGRSQCLNE